MSIRIVHAAASVLAAAPVLLWAWSGTPISGETADNAQQAAHHSAGKRGFEVWIADQSDTRPGFGGQLLIYEGSHLTGRKAARARPIAGSTWARPRPTSAGRRRAETPCART